MPSDRTLPTGRVGSIDLRPIQDRAQTSEPGSVRERHYSVQELARLWLLSKDSIRRLFLKEPGVIIYARQRVGGRPYRTLRIPESVALRVYSRLRRN